MRIMEAEGKTVEEAAAKAMAELRLPPECVELEVLAAPSSGLFGLIGTKPARVRVTEKLTPQIFLTRFLSGIMERMHLKGNIILETENDVIKINVTGSRMGILIGKRGTTLNSLQYLINVVYHKQFPAENKRVILDVEDYRGKREETLRTLAANLAGKAVRYKKEVVLEPMSPQERRIIHAALQENPRVSTYSQGEDPHRKVVIVPK